MAWRWGIESFRRRDRPLRRRTPACLGRALQLLRLRQQRRGFLFLTETGIGARELHVQASILIVAERCLDQRDSRREIPRLLVRATEREARRRIGGIALDEPLEDGQGLVGTLQLQ